MTGRKEEKKGKRRREGKPWKGKGKGECGRGVKWGKGGDRTGKGREGSTN